MTPTSGLRSIDSLRPHFSEIAADAQKVYDDWHQDENGIDPEYGAGGICDVVADRIYAVLGQEGVDCVVQHIEMDCHTLVIAVLSDGVVSFDIPASVYETGTGYVWRRREGIQITGDDVVATVLCADVSQILTYVDAWDGHVQPAPSAVAHRHS